MTAGQDDALTLEGPFDAGHLPQNYLPAAARVLRGDAAATDCFILLLPARPAPDGAAEGQSAGTDFAVVTAGSLAGSRARAGAGAGAAAAAPDDAGQSVLGPPTGLAAGGGRRSISFASADVDVDAAPALRRTMVVIDTGIAFWNRRFRDGGGCRFAEVQYLDFERPAAGGAGTIGRLQKPELDLLCARADLPGGELAMIRDLGARFPGSFFGPVQRPQRGTIWHGTAMADLAAGGLSAPEATALFALELPRAAMTDWGGDTLGGILAAAIRAALAMTARLSQLPCVLLLPYAFTGGPQDGSHPTARAVAQVLADARSAGRQVELVVPAGNHLQNRSVARLPAPGTGSAVRAVTLHLPPDDFSPATVEIVQAPGGAPWGDAALSLRSPRGQVLPLRLAARQMALIVLRGQRIGAVRRDSDLDGRARLRLTLFGTGRSGPGQVPAPFGAWQLALAEGLRGDLWLLRDDSDAAADRTRPHRQAVFMDGAYLRRGRDGAPVMTDPPLGALRRSGSASVLATAAGVTAAQAQERWGSGPPRQAWYGGRAANGVPFAQARVVDDGWPGRGARAVGNGSAQRFAVSGTSVAAALVARDLHA